MEEYKWIFIIAQKMECFPKNLFQLHKFMQGLLTGGRELVWTSFRSLLQVQAVPFITHVYSLQDGDVFVLLFNSSFLEVQ